MILGYLERDGIAGNWYDLCPDAAYFKLHTASGIPDGKRIITDTFAIGDLSFQIDGFIGRYQNFTAIGYIFNERNGCYSFFINTPVVSAYGVIYD